MRRLLAAAALLAACGGGAVDDRLSCDDYASLLCAQACERCGCGIGDQGGDIATYTDKADCLDGVMGLRLAMQCDNDPNFADDVPRSCDETATRSACGDLGGTPYLPMSHDCNPFCADPETYLQCGG